MSKRIVVLTGTNRGLGRRIAEILVEKYHSGFHYIFTQRSNDHTELREAFLKINPEADFVIQSLDVSVKESRQQFISWFTSNYTKLDVLFNNAGIAIQGDFFGVRPTYEIAQKTFHVNFFSTIDFTEELLPYFSEDAKILEMSSSFGQLENQPEAAKSLVNVEDLSKERIYELANQYIENTKSAETDLIFNSYAYLTSKLFLNLYIKFVATKYIKPNQSVIAVNPGWVQTDMGGKNADFTVDQACPDLAQIVAEYPFGRHPLNGKLIFQHKDIGY